MITVEKGTETVTMELLKVVARKCDCCERETKGEANPLKIKSFKKWLMGSDVDMCFDCFVEWYDGGKTDPEEIKKIVLGRVKP